MAPLSILSASHSTKPPLSWAINLLLPTRTAKLHRPQTRTDWDDDHVVHRVSSCSCNPKPQSYYLAVHWLSIFMGTPLTDGLPTQHSRIIFNIGKFSFLVGSSVFNYDSSIFLPADHCLSQSWHLLNFIFDLVQEGALTRPARIWGRSFHISTGSKALRNIIHIERI